MSTLTTVYYFTDGSLDQVSPETAAVLFASRSARPATRGETRSYLRQIAEDDSRACAVAERVDGFDRDDLGASADY